MRGFTLIEILVSLFVLGVLLVLSVVVIGSFNEQSVLANQAEEIAAQLRFAQNKTVASENSVQYGVYFNSATTPHQYELFRGTDYGTGTVENVYQLADEIEFDTIVFAGLSTSEAVFDRVSGKTSNPGDVTVRLKSNPAETQTVYVESFGKVEIGSSAAASDAARAKDTRHVHINYNGRAVDVSVATSETLRLDFAPELVTHDIILSTSLVSGEIDWEGEIDVAGEIQKIKIHTHQLNGGAFSNETEFSIHRDVRFNSKRVLLRLMGGSLPDITGTPTGKLIQYEDNGVITPGSESDYVIGTITQ
jgi:prepilin-type N-terminal cleavage/methylation domain-containing protein